MIDPVHEENGQWWFWDETWTYAHGPYESRENAEQACVEYARWLDGDPPHAETQT